MRLLVLAAIGLAAPCLAQQRAPAPPEAALAPAERPPAATIMAEPVALFLAGCDADGDGRTTRDEARACTARGYAAIDTGNKGSIGYIQFSDWSERWLGDRNALPSPYETDTDNDNRITATELDAVILRIFTRLDRDKDGVLVRAEMLTLTGRSGGFGDERPGERRRRRP